MGVKVPPGPAAAAVRVVARVLGATWSWRIREGGGEPGPAGEAGSGGAWRSVRPPVHLDPAVYVSWHEHLLPLTLLHRAQGVVALVSRHRDGEVLARVLLRLGYDVVRGSSTRGGGTGLREMIEAGRAGRPLAFTPDGPRGPARECKPGALRAAAETGLPVVPLAASASTYRRLESWDRFVVPAPGARIRVARGAPLHVPEGAPAGEDTWAERMRRALEAERRRAERAASGEGQ